MKKTNDKNNIFNFFRSKKFIPAEYEKDKISLIEKYNEIGYRDARIVWDSVYVNDDKKHLRYIFVLMKVKNIILVLFHG